MVKVSPSESKEKNTAVVEMLTESYDEASEETEEPEEVAAHMQTVFEGDKLVKFIQKIIFVLSVANLVVLCYGFFTGPNIYPWLFTIQAPILIGYRVYSYGKQKWHLFLLDYCYFANTLIFLYLWAFPHSEKLFIVCFATSHGPLAFAVITFRNSLVFHSVDKLTSLFIHVTPPLLLHTIRWLPYQSSSSWYANFHTCLSIDCVAEVDNDHFIWLVLIPLAAFVAHSMLYFIIVQVIFGKKIKKDKAYLTSYRWLTSNKNGMLFKIVNLFGKPGRIYMYGFYNWVYCLLSLIPCLLWFTSRTAGYIFLTIVLTIAAYNGASFYIEVFGRGRKN